MSYEPSDAEVAFDTRWKQCGGPAPEAVEYHFAAPLRQWRFDRAWPSALVAVEVEGGVFIGGGHTRGVGFTEDCAKYNNAAGRGWLVFRFTPDMVEEDPFGHFEPVFRVIAERQRERAA